MMETGKLYLYPSVCASMDDVPLKIPMVPSQAVEEDIKITVPDYLSILQDTEYDFSLEKWTIAGLQSGFSDHLPQQSPSSLGLQPSCPPYWMMFSSSQQSHLATNWEPNTEQSLHGLNPAVLSSAEFSNSDEDDTKSVIQEPKTCLSSLSASLSSLKQQHIKDLPQRSLSMVDQLKLHDVNQTQNPSLHHADISPPNTRVKTINRLHKSNSTKHSELLKPDCSKNQPANSSQSQDSTSEVLAALSPQERELLKAITGKGYPLQTAIIALQKPGHQTSDQVFSYLVACDHLCRLGYHMAQVEEALEMFQNCETKAEEFLHLLSQFDEMGFQQNAIKEVLLIHENHRERALEELMLRLSC